MVDEYDQWLMENSVFVGSVECLPSAEPARPFTVEESIEAELGTRILDLVHEFHSYDDESYSDFYRRQLGSDRQSEIERRLRAIDPTVLTIRIEGILGRDLLKFTDDREEVGLAILKAIHEDVMP